MWWLSSTANVCLPVILLKVLVFLPAHKSAHNAFMQRLCHRARTRQHFFFSFLFSSLNIKLVKSNSSLEVQQCLYLCLQTRKSYRVKDIRDKELQNRDLDFFLSCLTGHFIALSIMDNVIPPLKDGRCCIIQTKLI